MIKPPDMFYNIQRYFFPSLEEDLGELTPKYKEFIRATELIDISKYKSGFERKGIECKPHDRKAIVKGLIAKAILKIKETRGFVHCVKDSPVMRKLCEGETKSKISSESTFSRRLKVFLEIGKTLYLEGLSHDCFWISKPTASMAYFIAIFTGNNLPSKSVPRETILIKYSLIAGVSNSFSLRFG